MGVIFCVAVVLGGEEILPYRCDAGGGGREEGGEVGRCHRQGEAAGGRAWENSEYAGRNQKWYRLYCWTAIERRVS